MWTHWCDGSPVPDARRCSRRRRAAKRPIARNYVAQLAAGEVLLVTRVDRLARLTRGLLNTRAAIADRKAGFRLLGDAWAGTTTTLGRLVLTVLGGLAKFEGERDPRADERGARPRQGVRREDRAQAEDDPVPAARGDQAARERGGVDGDRTQLQR